MTGNDQSIMELYSIILYFAVLGCTAFLAQYIVQPAYNNMLRHLRSPAKRTPISGRYYALGRERLWIMALVCTVPILLLYGLREGIGTDYLSYLEIYQDIHPVDFGEYWDLHNRIVGSFYVEPGYYLINRIAPTYRALLFVDGILIFAPLWLGIIEFREKISLPFAVFIFFCTQFIYSMNGVRYIIAVSFIFLGFVYLINQKTVPFVISILIAFSFHTSAIVCLAFYLVKDFKSERFNKFRNIVFYCFVFGFAWLSPFIIAVLSKLPFFYRYFTRQRYAFSASLSGSATWLLHIMPVILPMLAVFRGKLFADKKSDFMFRIFISEIVFRMMGLYNIWFTRLARIPQAIGVIFIPYLLGRIDHKKVKIVLSVYYIAWYAFYFVYYIYVNDDRASIPYQWIWK